MSTWSHLPQQSFLAILSGQDNNRDKQQIYLLSSQTLKQLAKVSTKATLLTQGALLEFQSIVLSRTGEVAQWVKRLLFKHGDPCFIALAVDFPRNVSG